MTVGSLSRSKALSQRRSQLQTRSPPPQSGHRPTSSIAQVTCYDPAPVNPFSVTARIPQDNPQFKPVIIHSLVSFPLVVFKVAVKRVVKNKTTVGIVAFGRKQVLAS